MSKLHQYCVVVGVIIVFCQASLAVEPYVPKFGDPVNEAWRWRGFPELNGLGLRCITEGPSNQIWFGTDEGVHVYNGLTWTVWGEQHGLWGAPVYALCTSSDGRIYAGTERGISTFKAGVWQRVFPRKGNFHWPITNLMVAQDESVWASTPFGALHLSDKKSKLYTSAQIGKAMKILFPSLEIQIVGHEAITEKPWPSHSGIITMEASDEEGVELVVYGVAPNSPAAKAGLKIGDRILSIDGATIGVDLASALVGTANTRVVLTIRPFGKTEPKVLSFLRSQQVSGGFQHFNVHDVFESADGGIWMGLFEGDIVKFTSNKGTQSWKRFTEADGLQLGEEPRIGQSSDGKIITISNTALGGVNFYDGKGWTSVGMSGLGASDIQSSILQSQDGTIWIGGNSLVAFKQGKWRVYTKRLDNGEILPIPDHRMRILQSSDGALWVAGLGQYAARLDYTVDRWKTFENLIFQAHNPNGTQWFLGVDGGVVQFDGQTWLQYGQSDGVIDAPMGLYVTRDGNVWVLGSEKSQAAVSVFDGQTWSTKVFPQISWAFDRRAFLEAANGDIWLGGSVDMVSSENQFGGIVRFKDGKWDVFVPPEAPPFAYGIGESKDGTIWFIGQGMHLFFNGAWLRAAEPRPLAKFWTDAVWSSKKTGLWVGSRSYGVFNYDGSQWHQYTLHEGLADNRIYSLNESANGSIWATTPLGVSRFDAGHWKTQALPAAVTPIALNGLRMGANNALWLTQVGGAWYRRAWPSEFPPVPSEFVLRTVRYQPDNTAPETQITLSAQNISSPGNTVFAWKGQDPWQDTQPEDLEYSWRIDGSNWTPFGRYTFQLLEGLTNGKRRFEVRARDRDLNIDPTPALVEFTVGKK